MPFESEVKVVVFTNPTAPGGPTHFSLLQQLIEKTPASGTIRAAVSSFSTSVAAMRVARHFMSAAQKGVDVNIIISKEQPIVPKFQGSKVKLSYATSGCFGNGIHTKLYLFSETEYSIDGGPATPLRNVVVLGSANITSTAKSRHDNMVIIEDEQVYSGLLHFWHEMRHRGSENPVLDKEPENAYSRTIFSSSGRIKAYLFPRTDGGDTVAEIIRSLNVKSNPGPTIRIAVARWRSTRSAIKSAIEEAVGANGSKCKLEVVVADLRNNMLEWLKDLRRSYRDRVNIFTYNDPSAGSSSAGGSSDVDSDAEADTATTNKKPGIHSKYMLIEGRFGNSNDWQTMVWTGSPNWTDPALNKHDEIMIECRDKEMYGVYVNNHDLLKRNYFKMD